MKFHPINQFIKSTELRVIDDTGKQIGVMSREEALKTAQERGLDLVEIASQATPPVAKVIDFKKFKYLEAKKERDSKASSGKVDLKEIRFTPFIAQGDLASRLERIREILGDGDRVKVVVKFTGRQITRVEFGHELIKRIMTQLEGVATADGVPKLQGKTLFLILNPSKKKVEK
ncbi:MAG: translation initiation factor IF-3, translation initiation factor IF-3 [Microgenomates group bacterium GW2011_GWC1_46_16]|uniref:Translation initiation factor IF-3 n=2 Tax=Candidatus Collieribacteriota TaxID=1752725 RepID=A0A1F5FZ81_9BACT|nr:MAG: Translation initiation factor IF-3 [Microgenomates group bacterium GW2011_GWF1_46_12]KKU26379.1 MAG: translation initiation factor IF-3, translation initiation factor IF-3 [Microgenomates group bacterium GW2011_GWC1_46_16]KKU27787.1 MAG: Translation initiation factor IF-3 [Microgenomates group bacterium GW2011_GWF2_46_18]KKU43100.1 MAG: Translation initiation factor IF-3 [Microgenomates group bacterium GW2011_GWA1_46_7]KKU45423.1 MAG: Translation initiation factor IF-3 [Microgenomates g